MTAGDISLAAAFNSPMELYVWPEVEQVDSCVTSNVLCLYLVETAFPSPGLWYLRISQISNAYGLITLVVFDGVAQKWRCRTFLASFADCQFLRVS